MPEAERTNQNGTEVVLHTTSSGIHLRCVLYRTYYIFRVKMFFVEGRLTSIIVIIVLGQFLFKRFYNLVPLVSVTPYFRIPFTPRQLSLQLSPTYQYHHLSY